MTTTVADLAFITAAEAGKLFRSRELSPVELTQAHLERIERLQPTIRAYITVTADEAMASAKAAEAAILAGDERPLLGIPIAYKDIYWTASVRTTGGSKLYEHWIPEQSATTIAKLDAAGTVMLGKLITHEFANTITPEDHPFPPARNPWNQSRIPGGSSSGSGAALAAGLAVLALGTDTGGSIRHPGTASGIAALKPTYGLCSRAGVFPLSWTLDHTGPMTRTVEDNALCLNAMAGYDPLDPGSASLPVPDFTATLRDGIAGLRVGVLRSWYSERAKPEIVALVDTALGVLASLGAEVRDVELPDIALERCAGIISSTEAYTYHAQDLRERPELYPEQIRNRLRSGALYTASEYANAQRARGILRRRMAGLMESVDVLVTPTRGATALTFEEAYTDYAGAVSFTTLFNLTGQPAISIPCGFASDGMPVGMQIAGRPFEDATVLRASYAYEQATDWHTRHPEL